MTAAATMICEGRACAKAQGVKLGRRPAAEIVDLSRLSVELPGSGLDADRFVAKSLICQLLGLINYFFVIVEVLQKGRERKPPPLSARRVRPAHPREFFCS